MTGEKDEPFSDTLYFFYHIYFQRHNVSFLLPCGFPGGVLVVKNLSAIAGDSRDSGSILGLGRSPGGGNSNPLHYSCLGNPMDRGAWQATVLGVIKELDTTESSYTQNFFYKLFYTVFLTFESYLCNVSE